ncbi:tetratricopeptide repeat protein [Candidatus Omnitrophota bacterium]
MAEGKRFIYISIALIIGLGFTVYANSLDGKFIWDDGFLVKDNTHIRNPAYLSNLFKENIGAGAGEDFDFYRPLVMVSYMINYHFSGLEPRGYHLTNVLLHVLVALCLFWFLNVLYHDRILALIASVLFVIHPAHAESICYISGRSDPLFALFLLLSFIFYIKHLNTNNKAFLFVTLASYALALLSKESSLIFPLLLLIYHRAFQKKVKISRFLSIVGLVCIYLGLRLTVLKFAELHIPALSAIFQRIPGFSVAIITYLRLLILPFNLHMAYGEQLFSFSDPQAILGYFVVLALLGLALFRGRKNRLAFFAVFWFLITLLPGSNLYPLVFYAAEHFLYLPSIAFFLILAKGFTALLKKKELRIIAIVAVICLSTFYAYLTIRQNDYWQEPISFYKKTLEFEPDNPRVHTALGVAYSDLGKSQEAIAAYQKAIAVDPEYVQAYTKLGLAYREIGSQQEARALYEKAIEINPDYADAYNNLGIVYYYDLGKKEEAIALFQKAIQKNPFDAALYYNLGQVYQELGRYEPAIAVLEKAIKIDPDKEETFYVNLGNMCNITGRTEQAIAVLEKAIELNPKYLKARNNLGAIYSSIGEYLKAIKIYQQALKIDPDYAEAHGNLAITYYHRKQHDLAIQHYRKALRLGYKPHPEFSKALEALPAN